MSIYIGDVTVRMKGNAARGNTVSYPIVPGKTTPSYQLFTSDTLSVSASYKLTSGNSGRSGLKDSSVKLGIVYRLNYKGLETKKQVDRIFYLDDDRKFREKETFNIATDRFTNSVTNLEYSGWLK